MTDSHKKELKAFHHRFMEEQQRRVNVIEDALAKVQKRADDEIHQIKQSLQKNHLYLVDEFHNEKQEKHNSLASIEERLDAREKNLRVEIAQLEQDLLKEKQWRDIDDKSLIDIIKNFQHGL